jgi:hypothetical protein
VSSREKLRLLKNTVAPILLIILVLGIIFVGIATPVEAAGIGTFGALFVSALHRRLNWLNIQQAAIATLKATTMVMWIFFGATMFVGFFIVKGHSVADNADLPANHEKPGLGGRVRNSRCKAGRRPSVVRRHLYGQHADGIPVTAIRLLAVLSQERCAAADNHGHDLPRRGQFHGAAVDQRRPLHLISAECLVAAEYSVRRPLRRPTGSRQSSSEGVVTFDLDFDGRE